ncbi:MAG: ADP-ribosylglycohydrolase family protein [Anaerolineae bacterium]|nr:ADP-ribosylglycohydrolase family protein [Anaerolineae bacterium]NUQ03688.1 ADP-ribosylglycohydrolase family protein [Anaerolineae bacterium]
MSLPVDYAERVYAGWLGKCIGVRFGAPLENWTYEEIRDNLGALTGYVFEDQGKIFKPDDDTSVPLILLDALAERGDIEDAKPADFGEALLNAVGCEHGSFWWGGYGVSTEHTAYLNLLNGIAAPRSGSIAQNGRALAEQIGGQIFSDVWGLLLPNDPRAAADLSERASSVSHDGAGLHGARFIAAAVSAAFSERDPRRLIEIALEQVPSGSDYDRVMRAMIAFHAAHPEDWHEAFAHLKVHFGYQHYAGMVPIIPNAGVVGLGLLYGEGDFSRALQIANMAGWDTDCNVGNVGAIMGVAVGLDGIEARWREPMNDLLIAASVIGTRSLLTLPQCADRLIRLGQRMSGAKIDPPAPRRHFTYPGSTGGFQAWGDKGRPIHLLQTQVNGTPVLRTAIRKLNKKGEIRIFTRTSYRPRELSSNYYGAAFTPLLYPGQTIHARVQAPADAPATLRAALYVYDENHRDSHQATGEALTPGVWHDLLYTLPPMTDALLSQVGVVLRNTGELWETGAFHLAHLDWDGPAQFTSAFAFAAPETGAISEWTYWRGFWRMEEGAYHGSGPLENESYTGDIGWTDYRYEADITPLLGDHHLILARVQGAMRSYAFGLSPDNSVTLYRKARDYQPVASAAFPWRLGERFRLTLTVQGNRLMASVEGGGEQRRMAWQDDQASYRNGQIGLACWHGSHMACHSIACHSIEG